MSSPWGAKARPFTGLVLPAEMNNGFSLLLPLKVAALVGYFVGECPGGKPISERLFGLSEEERGAFLYLSKVGVRPWCQYTFPGLVTPHIVEVL
jgi:hypothetical protein